MKIVLTFLLLSICHAQSGPIVSGPVCPATGMPSECCDVDGDCMDGDDDYCCDGMFFCSNDGEEYAKSMGGTLCSGSSTNTTGGFEFCYVCDDVESMEDVDEDCLKSLFDACNIHYFDYCDYCDASFQNRQIDGKCFDAAGETYGMECYPEYDNGTNATYSYGPPCPDTGMPSECCDVDGDCMDGDDDYCCDGSFYCSNDGEEYAKAMGGISCHYDAYGPACPDTGMPSECCDVDGDCMDGDDDYCCNGRFFCSNDGEDYAKAMGGFLCYDFNATELPEFCYACDDVESMEDVDEDCLKSLFDACDVHFFDYCDYCDASFQSRQIDERCFDAAGETYGMECHPEHGNDTNATYSYGPPCPDTGMPSECCDVDGDCMDGDDDYCCDGRFYCSNDGQEYARGMGGILCPQPNPSLPPAPSASDNRPKPSVSTTASMRPTSSRSMGSSASSIATVSVSATAAMSASVSVSMAASVSIAPSPSSADAPTTTVSMAPASVSIDPSPSSVDDPSTVYVVTFDMTVSNWDSSSESIAALEADLAQYFNDPVEITGIATADDGTTVFEIEVTTDSEEEAVKVAEKGDDENDLAAEVAGAIGVGVTDVEVTDVDTQRENTFNGATTMVPHQIMMTLGALFVSYLF